jgi:prephenate dehydrogenase
MNETAIYLRLSSLLTTQLTLTCNPQSGEAKNIGVEFYPHYEMSKFVQGLDVVILAVPMIKFEDIVCGLPADLFRGKLVVDVCPLFAHPKEVMLRVFGSRPDVDILCSHPMFGPIDRAGAKSGSSDGGDPYSSSTSWDGRPLVYEKVRISNVSRLERYLRIFEDARCRLVEMNAEQHDASIADAEFVTHLTGRLLVDKELLPPAPVISKEYAALCDVADMTAADSFDLFFGMFKFNQNARKHLTKMRDNLATLERQLAAKEAYLAASAEMQNSDRQRLIAETRLLLQEIAKNGNLEEAATKVAATAAPDEQKSK